MSEASSGRLNDSFHSLESYTIGSLDDFLCARIIEVGEDRQLRVVNRGSKIQVVLRLLFDASKRYFTEVRRVKVL